MGANKTGLRSFDRLTKDPRVEEIRREGADGYFVDLAQGYTFEGCISVRGDTVRAVLELMRLVKP